MRVATGYNRAVTPNGITALRAGLVVILAGLIALPALSRRLMWIAVVIASVAAALDAVDGWLARRQGSVSAFGARFDMETDAALILVLAVLAWRWGKAGPWVLVIGGMRYFFVIAGWLLPWLRAPLAPTLRGKTVAVVQMVTLIVCLGPVVPVWFSTAGAAGALAMLGWSFAIDVRRLWLARAVS